MWFDSYTISFDTFIANIDFVLLRIKFDMSIVNSDSLTFMVLILKFDIYDTSNLDVFIWNFMFAF